MQPDHHVQVRHHALKDALAFALRSTHEARVQGIKEHYLSEVYARAGYWSGAVRDYPLAQSLMWLSIELRRQADIPSPYSWTELLIQYGGRPSDPWSYLRPALAEALAHTQRWVKLNMIHLPSD